MLLHKFFKSFSNLKLKSNLLKLSPEVQNALKLNLPILSLQSTIISHGMPYPQNYQCALQVQAIVRQNGVLPATIALIDGKICVGLNNIQIQKLAFQGSNGKVRKTSRRDIAYCLSQKKMGATTVASSIICSHMAGIPIFVTGGIGGVHRQVEQTLDISADLTELGRTPVAVICAGVKSILDIPKTLEYLQTQGVPVLSYGSQYFPAFYSASSGIKSPLSMNSVDEIARFIKKHQQLQLQNGIVIGIPNPHQAEAIVIQKAVQQALIQLKQQNITGPQVTPFLLRRVKEKTHGSSLTANISLVKNNAKIGSQIAMSYYNLSKLDESTQKNINIIKLKQKISQRPIIIGGSAVDTFISPLPTKEFQVSRSNPGNIKNCFGGVGRNISEAAGRLNSKPILITALGKDQYADNVKKHLQSTGVSVYQIKSKVYNTAKFMNVIRANGDMMVGIADMKINQQLTFEAIYDSFFKNNQILPNTLVVIDSNVTSKELQKLIQFLDQKRAVIYYQCISGNCIRIVQSGCINKISFLKMNQVQEDIIKKFANNFQFSQNYLNTLGSKKKSQLYREILVTRGQNGISHYSIKQNNMLETKYPVFPVQKIIKTLGAGDTVTGTLISSICKGLSIEQSIRLGIAGAKIALQSGVNKSTISQELSFERIQKILKKFKI